MDSITLRVGHRLSLFQSCYDLLDSKFYVFWEVIPIVCADDQQDMTEFSWIVLLLQYRTIFD